MRNGAAMMTRGLFVAAAAAALVGPAAAQAPMVRELAGRWQILPTDGTPGCEIALTATPAGPARWRAIPERACATRVPESRGVVAWTLRSDTLLLDARGRARMTFVEDETALPSSPDLQSPRHYLIPRIPGYTRVPLPADLVGRWTLGRRGGAGGGRRCALTFAAGGRLRRDGACQAAGIAKGLTRWAVDGLDVLLSGPGDAMLLLSPVRDRRYVADGWVLAR